MRFITGVMRLFGADDVDAEREQIMDYPSRRTPPPAAMRRDEDARERIISMPEPDTTTVYIARPEREEAGGRLFNVKTYADYLRTRQALVLDINELARGDFAEATRVVDYLTGAVEMVDGTVWEVTKNVFIFAPHNVHVDGDPLKQIEMF